jgi:hypothetical protein
VRYANKPPFLRRSTTLNKSYVCWHGQDVPETREVSETGDTTLFITLKCVNNRTLLGIANPFPAVAMITNAPAQSLTTKTELK